MAVVAFAFFLLLLPRHPKTWTQHNQPAAQSCIAAAAAAVVVVAVVVVGVSWKAFPAFSFVSLPYNYVGATVHCTVQLHTLDLRQKELKLLKRRQP